TRTTLVLSSQHFAHCTMRLVPLLTWVALHSDISYILLMLSRSLDINRPHHDPLAASCFNLATSFPRRNGLRPRLETYKSAVIPARIANSAKQWKTKGRATYMASLVRILYVPLGCTLPTTSPSPFTSTLPRMSSGQAILTKSGGF